jgi:hypothetical protein
MHEKKVLRPYRRELVLSIVVYVVLLFGSIRLGRPMADGALRTFILLSPMIGFALMLRAIIRHVARIDEYLRQRQLENFALAAAITAGASFTYGFLETAGFPRLSMFTVWPILCGSWGLTNFVRARLLQQ